tara:strand:+ start:277 stop:669 length:393 start_codon:yes stop_codon:yes gene_type:complete
MAQKKTRRFIPDKVPAPEGWTHQFHGEIITVKILITRLADEVTARKLMNEVKDFLKDVNGQLLLLDFTKVVFMTSSMLGQLVQFRNEIQAMEGKLGLVGISPSIRSVFHMTRLESLFEFYDTLDQALKGF